MPASLRQILKEGTQDLHEAAEQGSLLSDIFASHFTREAYEKILRAFYQIHFHLESKLIEVKDLQVLVPDLMQRMKAASLQSELGNVEVPPLLESPFADLNLSQAFGILYVLEGSTLGGQMIQRKLRENPLFENAELSYYNHYGNQVGLYWQKFIGFLEQAFADQKIEAGEVLQAARSVFQVMGRSLQKPVA